MIPGLSNSVGSNPYSLSQNPYLPRNLNDVLTQYQITQQGTIQQPQPRPNAITELDEFLSSLTVDKKAAVESSPDYQNLKLKLFERFLTFEIALTPHGEQFLNTPAGRKISQDLLDVAQKVSNTFEDKAKNEFEQMKNMIAQHSAVIEQLQQQLSAVKPQTKKEAS